MVLQRRYLLIGREGLTQESQPGFLTSEAIQTAFTEGMSLCRRTLGDQKIFPNTRINTPSRTFLNHTDAKPTLYTGQAVLVGALGLSPYDKKAVHPPQRQQEFTNYPDLRSIDTAENLYFKPHSPAPEGVVNFWLQNPQATEYRGQTIDSYATMLARMTEGLTRTIRRLTSRQYNLGVIVTETPVAEAALLRLLVSDGIHPKRMEDIGDCLSPGEFMTVMVDEINGGHAASVQYKNRNGLVNLQELMCV